MLRAAVVLLIVAVLSALAGWNGVAVGAACLAQVGFGLFLVTGLAEPFRRPVRREHYHHGHLLPAR